MVAVVGDDLSAVATKGFVAPPPKTSSVQVLPVSVSLDFDADLACDWRDGDVW